MKLAVPPPADTAPEAWAFQVAALRGMGAGARSAAAFRLTALAREATRAGIGGRHPAYTGAEVGRAFFRLMHGDAVTRAVWPDLPLLDP